MRSYAEPLVRCVTAGRSIRLPLTVMTNETAVQLLKGYQDLACDKRSVSPETGESHVMVIGRT